MDADGAERKEEKQDKVPLGTPTVNDDTMEGEEKQELNAPAEYEEVEPDPPPGLLPRQVKLPSDASAGLTTYLIFGSFTNLVPWRSREKTRK